METLGIILMIRMHRKILSNTNINYNPDQPCEYCMNGSGIFCFPCEKRGTYEYISRSMVANRLENAKIISIVIIEEGELTMGKMESHMNEIVEWLKERTKEAHANGLVVGVSGGLDSAVVAALIKKAFPDNSLGVMMPLKSNPHDVSDAKKTIDAIGIDSLEIELEEAHKALFEPLQKKISAKDEWQEAHGRLADANLRARLRMGTLYTIATNYNYLVVGTDNAAEWYTGYFTKYGDGGVDLLPLVTFTKGEVREMARELEIPASVVEKKPSADLWAGQTDEDEMGTTYDRIDAYLKGGDIPDHDKEIIERMHERTAHKREPIKQFHRNG